MYVNKLEMIGYSSRQLILCVRGRLYTRLGKKVLAFLCLIISGTLIAIFAPTKPPPLTLKEDPLLPREYEFLPYASESKRHLPARESSIPASKPVVNHTFGSSKRSEQPASNTTRQRDDSSKAMTGLSALLRKQVESLRDAIEAAHRQELPLAKEPKCTGNLLKGEVEDILCIPRPKFIKEVRNPCWWEPSGKSRTLRCFPFFHILGCEKCGSSDLWDRITLHPYAVRINGTLDKEADWWGWQRYGRFHHSRVKVKNFTDYLKHFEPLTQKVEQSLRTGGKVHKHIVTGDGTPSDLMDFRGWVNIAQNRGRKLPHVLTPHLMKHMYPETTKFIVILRNPIERLYSDFCFATNGRTAEGFHTKVIEAISFMVDCIKGRSVHECFFDYRMYRRGRLRLHLILYALYLTEWLKVIPREKFLFLKTEEYAKDIPGTLKKCYEFLGLESLNDRALKKIGTLPHSLQGAKKRNAGPMWRSTRTILEEVIRPSMHFLPELLQDDRFVWDFNSIPVVDH